MKQTRSVELGTGLFVFLGVAALFFLTTQTTNLDGLLAGDGYVVTARFDNVGTLTLRSPVQMAGVSIGQVEAIEFDPEILDAVVRMRLDGRYRMIPDDSDASVLTAGLLGGQYIGLEAGASDTFLEDGSEIEFTQSAIVLEKLIGKYLLNRGSGD